MEIDAHMPQSHLDLALALLKMDSESNSYKINCSHI